MKSHVTVLSIEDNPGDRLLLTEYASEVPGLYIRSVDSLLSAMAELRAYEPDVATLDLGLPDSGELQSLKILIAMKLRSKIVVLTGHENFALASEAISLGADDYVFKSQLSSALLKEVLFKNTELESMFSNRELNWRAMHTKRSLELQLKKKKS